MSRMNQYRRALDVEMKYKRVFPYVSVNNPHGPIIWIAKIFGSCEFYDNERDAAIYVDKALIKRGKEPINILKKRV
jgi:hypothetical protein